MMLLQEALLVGQAREGTLRKLQLRQHGHTERPLPAATAHSPVASTGIFHAA